jgi:hypothetical protein
MRGAKVLVVFAIAALAVGTFSAAALAGKPKKKTAVIFFSSSPKFNKSGKVTAKGALNTSFACKGGRSVRLQLLDGNGAVIAVLDGSTSDLSGNWKLQGQMPSLAPGAYTVRVKALKFGAKKFVCRAGVSAPVPVPPPSTQR